MKGRLVFRFTVGLAISAISLFDSICSAIYASAIVRLPENVALYPFEQWKWSDLEQFAYEDPGLSKVVAYYTPKGFTRGQIAFTLYSPSGTHYVVARIERFWKFISNECLYSKYYANLDDFKAAISTCIATANTNKKEKLSSLLTLNFQTFFKKVQILTV
jgi:hypothetical protein